MLTKIYTYFLHFICSPAIEDLEFLEGRKKQYMRAALQAKQKNNMEQAKAFLRTAKGFDPLIEAARSGKTVDVRNVRRQELYPGSILSDLIKLIRN